MIGNGLYLWLDPKSLETLAVALGHFLWQAAIIGGFAAVISRLLAETSPRLRYATHLVCFFGMAVCIPLTVFQLGHTDPLQTENLSTSIPTFAASEDGETISQSIPSDRTAEQVGHVQVGAAKVTNGGNATSVSPTISRREPAPIAWYVVAAWVVGVASMVLRLLLAVIGAWRLSSASQAVTQASVLEAFRTVAQNLQLRIEPGLAWCEHVAVPVVVGILRPVVLLPPSLLPGMERAQLEALLTHALAHVRRLDPVVHLLQCLLFFHPCSLVRQPSDQS